MFDAITQGTSFYIVVPSTPIDVPYIYSSEELKQLFLASLNVEAPSPNKLPGIVRLKRLEIRRVKESSRRLMEVLWGMATRMPFLRDLHPFYRDILTLFVDEASYRHAVARIAHASKAISSIAKDALTRIRIASDYQEVRRARKMYIARIIDLLNDLSGELNLLAETAKWLRKLPAIDPSKFTIVVAGAPNVGKSSFVRCVSTAKPEVADYPFTTKQITVGHIDLMGVKVQIIDTPGLLDRPLSERNKIELQAILALRHLANIIIFLVDPTPHSGFGLSTQARILGEIRESFSAPIHVIVNKADIADMDEIKRTVEALGVGEYWVVSSSECRGAREAVYELLDRYFVPRFIEELRARHVA